VHFSNINYPKYTTYCFISNITDIRMSKKKKKSVQTERSRSEAELTTQEKECTVNRMETLSAQ
jgi:hypothetical protein